MKSPRGHAETTHINTNIGCLGLIASVCMVGVQMTATLQASAQDQQHATPAPLNIVPTGDAEMSIYHSRSGHRYTLRTDGFISVRAGAAEGELTTKPVRFAGGELVLNVSTSASGSVRVEIQDDAGVPLAGFALADCLPIVGDAIERAVRWSSDPDVGVLAGKPVRLRFVMKEADLFSFRLREKRLK